MQSVFGSSQFLPVPSTSAAAQNSSGMDPSFWGPSTSHPVDKTQGGRFTDFSINAILRPISNASSNGEDPSAAYPVFTGQLNQDLEGDYPGTATGVEERAMGRNDPIPLPYLNNDHEMASDWPPSTSASDDSAQAGPSTSTSAATNASSLFYCRVSSKDVEEILLHVSETLGISRGRAENRPDAQFSKVPRKIKTKKVGKLRRSVRNRNGAASSTVSAGSAGDLKSRNTGPWRLRSSIPPQKIHFSDDNKQANLDGAETSSLTSCSSSEYN